ncbi:predicted protein [Sclerotinia sclerotiorum 1980 UF-70]|uniref:Uncharacterized protein n=1 Tax=Sclerotinia sclerotiorum (strain ATCC 18683 / 1980 / Ss-1) TaxID=665079 RepID=A7EQW9_SCLS1|nr:predicted protein [Sclerotinia sclerotiorum 1980 UF-70]EDN91861.1 predicted protein [Sclerotinia sclerotiorum 1980 UF-70]
MPQGGIKGINMKFAIYCRMQCLQKTLTASFPK